MATVRVMLGPMPALLRGILEETLRHNGDIMLVGPPAPALALSAAVTLHRPDVVVVGGAQSAWLGEFSQVLFDRLQVHVLAIDDDARTATMHEVNVRRWPLADVSPESIVAAVRAVAPADHAPAMQPGAPHDSNASGLRAPEERA